MSGATHIIKSTVMIQAQTSEDTACPCWSADPRTLHLFRFTDRNMRERIYTEALFLLACTELAQLHKIDFLPELKYEKSRHVSFSRLFHWRITLKMKFNRWMNGWMNRQLLKKRFDVRKQKQESVSTIQTTERDTVAGTKSTCMSMLRQLPIRSL